jgi:hypothetical protein
MRSHKSTTKKDNILAKLKLEEVIAQLTEKTQVYANKPDAKEWLLEKRNKQLAELHEIYNAIPDLSYTSIWAQLEESFKDHNKTDNSLDGHLVIFKYNESGSNYSYTILNLFD